MTLSNQKLLFFYEQMVTIRRFEEIVGKAYANQKIKGFCHLYIGEEPVAVGAIGALDKTDYVVSTYRDHGHALAKGVPPNEIMAELFGKKTGSSGGLGGSMHLFDYSKRFMGGHGIVGGHVSLATGMAFAISYKKKKDVVLCFLGEGAVSIGGFHEGISLASLWRLPVVFIIENNLYSMGTPIYRHLKEHDISLKAQGYGMPGFKIQGSDVSHIYSEIKKAVNQARSGGGPTLIEIVTYRYRGHSMSDPAKYRTKDELKQAKDEDPILLTKNQLLQNKITEEQLEQIDKQSKKIAQEAFDFAENSKFPDINTLYDHVYSKDL